MGDISLFLTLMIVPILLGMLTSFERNVKNQEKYKDNPQLPFDELARYKVLASIAIVIYIVRFIPLFWGSEILIGSFGTFHIINTVCYTIMGLELGAEIYAGGMTPNANSNKLVALYTLYGAKVLIIVYLCLQIVANI